MAWKGLSVEMSSESTQLRDRTKEGSFFCRRVVGEIVIDRREKSAAERHFLNTILNNFPCRTQPITIKGKHSIGERRRIIWYRLCCQCNHTVSTRLGSHFYGCGYQQSKRIVRQSRIFFKSSFFSNAKTRGHKLMATTSHVAMYLSITRAQPSYAFMPTRYRSLVQV